MRLVLLFLPILGFCTAFHSFVATIGCMVCIQRVTQLEQVLFSNGSTSDLSQFTATVCNILGGDNPMVCNNLLGAFQDELLFVLSQRSLDPAIFCSLLFPNCTSTEPPVAWTVDIPNNQPKNKPWPKPSGSSYRVLHLTDIHIDREYEEGSEADCSQDSVFTNFWLCCRNSSSSGPVKTPAGKWGSVKVCDIPFRTFESALKHISKAHKNLDYIILTGDYEAHAPWNYTREGIIDNIQNVTATLLQYFPNIPIYGAIGNHEGVPQDSMAPHSIPQYDQRGPQWLYSEMVKMWGNWVPKSTFRNIQYRASYSLCPKPGLRLISVNNIYCSSFNFYIYLNQTDPDGTLQWLVKELSEAEKKGEKVHIITHIPNGDNYCLKDWSANYFNIIERFQNTIRAQFFGHTHQDQFEIYYDKKKRPFNVNWVTPSLTTFYYNNPAYRIYEIDQKSHAVIDFETYWTDLEEANRSGREPKWELEYRFKSAFGLQDLSPRSLHYLSRRLISDDGLFQKYVRFYWRSDYDSSCHLDPSCRQKYICDILSARSNDPSQCTVLE